MAVAEIDYQDLWQRAVVAAVTVSCDREHAEKVLQRVEDEAAALLGSALVERHRGVDRVVTGHGSRPVDWFLWMNGAYYGSPKRSRKN